MYFQWVLNIVFNSHIIKSKDLRVYMSMSVYGMGVFFQIENFVYMEYSNKTYTPPPHS